MKGQKGTRWEVSHQSASPAVLPRPMRWRSYDLKGPLPRSTTRALEVAIYSLPAHTPWPALDEEGWWRDVLADRRLRRSSAKALSEKDEDAGQRLDRLPVKSLTFSCAWCGQRDAELIRMFGRDRNVRTIGRHVLKCRDRRPRREGEECPITYLLNAMVRPRLALLACLALGACATAPMPTGWTRADGRAVDPKQLEADKAICRDEVDQAARITAARHLAPITLPGQDSPAVKLSIDCMARRGYSPVR